MNVKPRRWHDGRLKPIIPSESASNGRPRMAIECEGIGPRSSVGRTVYLFLDDEDVTELLLELRSAAVEARSRSLEAR